MSQYYDVGDETLWNPSNGASRLFLEQLAIFEAEIGLPSGIGPMEADECQVDPAALDVFVNALLAWHRGTRHVVVRALSERAGVDLRWEVPSATPWPGVRDMHVPPRPPTPAGGCEDAWASRLREKVHALAPFMAH